MGGWFIWGFQLSCFFLELAFANIYDAKIILSRLVAVLVPNDIF